MRRFLGLLLLIAGISLFLTTAPNAAAQDDPGGDDSSEIEAGQAIFLANCSRCHADDGTGIFGVGPSLVDVADRGDRSRHIEFVTGGRFQMPAFSPSLSDEEISQVVSFVRIVFGGATADPAVANEITETDGAVTDEDDVATDEDDAATDEDGAATDEDDAATDEEVSELPATGTETAVFAIVGIALVGAGLQLVAFRRPEGRS